MMLMILTENNSKWVDQEAIGRLLRPIRRMSDQVSERLDLVFEGLIENVMIFLRFKSSRKHIIGQSSSRAAKCTHYQLLFVD